MLLAGIYNSVDSQEVLPNENSSVVILLMLDVFDHLHDKNPKVASACASDMFSINSSAQQPSQWS